MISFDTNNWIQTFFGINNLIRNKRKYIKPLKSIKKHRDLNLKNQVNILFKNLILETIYKLGKLCGEYSKFKFDSKVNQQQLLKCFVEGKFLKNGIWLFKYRKYFPKIFIEKGRQYSRNTYNTSSFV